MLSGVEQSQAQPTDSVRTVGASRGGDAAARASTDAISGVSAGRCVDDACEASVIAGRSARAWAIFLSAFVVSLVLDLVTKVWAFKSIADAPVVVHRDEVLRVTPELWRVVPQHAPRVVIDKLLELTLVLNPGAVFGIGAGKRWFFIIFTGIAMAAGLTIFAKFTRARDWAMHLAIGLIVGSGLGNLYDRVTFGCVRDFIHPLPGMKLPGGVSWPWGGNEVWPYVSNVADALLIVGMVMISWRVVFGGKKQAK